MGSRLVGWGYLWVTKEERCWEARDLEDRKRDERRSSEGSYENPVRDFSKYLNEKRWGALARKRSRQMPKGIS
jgi:hypothetical protein